MEVRPGDIAIYIGTIHYHRDEFWKITSVEVEDDYERVIAECLKKWGPSAVLRKSLLDVTSAERKDR